MPRSTAASTFPHCHVFLAALLKPWMPVLLNSIAAFACQDDEVEELIDPDNHPVAMEHPHGGPGDDSGQHLTREEVVHEFFSYLFPDSFQLALPVLNHKVHLFIKEHRGTSSRVSVSGEYGHETFSYLFPHSFQLALPVLEHKVHLVTNRF